VRVRRAPVVSVCLALVGLTIGIPSAAADRGQDGVTTPVANLSRVTVDGSTGVNDYLRVTIDPDNKDVLTWTRVPFTS
jgi:hypothetical protein